MADFSNYELSPDFNVYELADGLLPRVAEAVGFELTPQPEEANLGAFIAKVGPDRELQKNISAVKEALGENAVSQVADWIDESSILYPVARGFREDSPIPEEIDAVVWSGGVANWILRRAAMTQRLDPEKVRRVVLPFGTREMKPGEHQLVKTFEKREGKLPTEADFVKRFVRPSLEIAGFSPEIIDTGEDRGDDVLPALFEQSPDLLDGNILVVSNAPNAIQAAGQLRVAAKMFDSNFDARGDQLYMQSDGVPLARRGEAAATHQNPMTALGQLNRNALFLERNKSA